MAYSQTEQIKTLFDEALAHHQAGRMTQAQQGYTNVLRLEPQHIDANHLLGVLLGIAGEQDRALELIERAISLCPHANEFWGNKALILQQMARYEEALVSIDRCLQLKPLCTTTLYNRGNILKALGRLDEAIASFQRASILRLRSIKEIPVGSKEQYLLQQDIVLGYWNLALTLLLKGNLEQGWLLYEYRWQWDNFPSTRRNFKQPLWLGQAKLAGKTIFLHSEQGLGDTLQFCRYVPLLKAQGARVILAIEPPLVSLLSSLQGLDMLISQGNQIPDFDYHCPLLTLPLACRTWSLESIPAQVPYLSAPSAQMEVWRNKLGKKSKPRVGLVWSSGARPGLPEYARRDIPFQLIAQLNRDDIDFYSLQKGQPAESLLLEHKNQYWSNDNFYIFSEDIKDFSDTAALIGQLDLVISVCTSVVHLAGALGVPTWVLLPSGADWRWLLERTDSPWYPTLRLFRQKQFGDWQSVIQLVQEELNHFVASASPP